MKTFAVIKLMSIIQLLKTGFCFDPECPPRWFNCGESRCISDLWVCDGDNDCGNLKDERNCDNRIVNSQCISKQFQCKSDGHCIPQTWHCDGDVDCEDASDEKDCENIQDSCKGFRCRNHYCISSEWRCDGNRDCPDGSDEEMCPSNKFCTDSEFLCSSGSCIKRNLVCNGRPDCFDGSDEGSHCSDSCEIMGCSQKCENTPSGPKCKCDKGYTLTDNKTCLDIDECLMDGICSHKCINTLGSFKCSCQDGYELINATCKATGAVPLLIFWTPFEIRGMRLGLGQYYLIRKAIYRASTVDLDPKDQRVYWVEVSNGSSVYSANLDGSGFSMVLRHGLIVPEDIAVDYIAHNLYITDSGLRQVVVCKISGTMCHVLHTKKVEKPRSVILDLEVGLMYWSDWGENAAGIYRSGMDGSKHTSIVFDNVGWPNGISIDHTTNRLYWADVLLKHIEYITLDGSSRQVILNSEVHHPYSLAVFEDTIYWADWSTFSLESCNKFTGHKMSLLARENGKHIMGVHVYHPVLMAKVTNPCWSNDCSHMCLISPSKGFICACPHGFELSADERSCTIKENEASIFVNEGSSIFYIRPEAIGSETVTELPHLLNTALITRVSYDAKSRYLFVADANVPAIHAINMTSLQMRVLVKNHITFPGDLSFDWTSSNLYWIDSIKGTVEVISTKSLKRAMLLKDLLKPVALGISPNRGHMFIATDNQPSVSMYDMNGENRRILHGIQGVPMSLAPHPSKSILFWADPIAETISYIEYLNSSPAKILIDKLDGVMSVAASEDYVYWTARKRELNMMKGNMTYILQLPGQEKEYVSRKVIHAARSTATEKSLCSVSNGGCSYLCITSSNGRTCVCPTEMLLAADNKTCLTRRCEPNDFRCMNSGRCLSVDLRCDGNWNCEDGSDEVGCGTRCSGDDFQCRNGRCILKSWRCDRRNDCADNSDEEDCPETIACGKDQISCTDGECISILWRCDGEPDCADSSDEMNCNETRCDPESQMRCDNGQCVPVSWVCDQESDCLDKSDERNCSSTCEGFFCYATGQCLDWSRVCDGNIDCENLPDEGGLCSRSCSSDNGGCSHICNRSPEGSKCECFNGYRLLSDNKTCDDINECLEPSTCSHFCNNTKGGYKCSCAEGYFLQQDHHTCKADGTPAYMVYLLTDQIRGFDLSSQKKKVYISFENANMRGMDYDSSDGVFYWTEGNDGSINRYSPDTHRQDILVTFDLKPIYVRYDWIQKNLYYIDEVSNIRVCTKYGQFCRTLIYATTHMDTMDISPTTGVMFWTIWGSHRQEKYGLIERADMDGSNRLIIVSEQTIKPTAITVDHVLKMIYWTDVELNVVECSDFQGSKRRQVIKYNMRYPYALAVFEDNVYWSDWGSNSIIRCKKFSNEDCKKIIEKHSKARVLMVVHKVTQPKGTERCLGMKCPHLCLPTRTSSICMCADEFYERKGSCLPKTIPTVPAPPTECPERYCLDDAECEVRGGQFICKCPPPYTGRKCEIIIRNPHKGYDYSWIVFVMFILMVMGIIGIIVLLCCDKRKELHRLKEYVALKFHYRKAKHEGRLIIDPSADSDCNELFHGQMRICRQSLENMHYMLVSTQENCHVKKRQANTCETQTFNPDTVNVFKKIENSAASLKCDLGTLVADN